jgi:uncharacterized protein YdbL (DUF1318 family)
MLSRLCRIALLSGLLASCAARAAFPEDEIRQTAEDIVDDTWKDGSPDRKPAGLGTHSHLPWRLDFLRPAAAHAASRKFVASNATIRMFKASITARSDDLKPYLRSGGLGIANDGLLVVRDLTGLPVREQGMVRKLVDAENRDRLRLYREIARANDLGKDRVPEIQKIFAETWIEKAEPGWSVQQSNGMWTTR